MSRADQASEPSMEDILASIRRIIADETPSRSADEQAGPAGSKPETPQGFGETERAPVPFPVRRTEPRRAQRPQGITHPVSAAVPGHGGESERADASAQEAAAPHQEEVLELTDELIFPEDSPAQGQTQAADAGAGTETAPPAQAVATQAENAERSAASEPHAKPEIEPSAARQPASPFPPFPIPSGNEGASAAGSGAVTEPENRDGRSLSQPERLAAQRSSESNPPRQYTVRSLWSRRELPASPAAAATQPAPAPQRHTPRPQQQSIPQHQSVQEERPRPSASSFPRWPGDFQAPVPEEGPRGLFPDFPMPEPQAAGGSGSRDQQPSSSEPPAEVEESLGRLARSAVTALDDTELKEAGRIDFTALEESRRASVARSFAEALGQNREPAEVAPEQETAPQNVEDAPPTAWDAPQPEAPQDYSETPERQEMEATEAAPMPYPSFNPPAPQKAAEVRGWAQHQSADDSSPAGAAPAQSSSGPTLEESVREMLRPMLVEWLNENMPRILEDAIREEIRSRGLPLDPGRNS